MTTICYKAGVIAADSAVVWDGVLIGSAVKIRSHGDCYAVATGQLADIELFHAWVSGSDKPKFDDDLDGIVVRSGIFTHYDEDLTGYTFSEVDGVWAIGSGRDFALGAMAAGSSAEEACLIACKYDVGSAGPVEVRRL